MKRTFDINNKLYTLPENLILGNINRFSSKSILNELYLLHKTLDHLLYKVFKIDYFLVGGSLIGQCRHNTPIPWDDDGDICVFDKDINKLRNLSKYLNQQPRQNYILIETYPGFVFRRKKSKTFIDIFCLSKHNNYYKYGYPYINGKPTFKISRIFKKEVYLENDIFPIKRGKFCDYEVSIPNNYVKILNSHYGKDVLYKAIKAPLISTIAHTLGNPIREHHKFNQNNILNSIIYKILELSSDSISLKYNS